MMEVGDAGHHFAAAAIAFAMLAKETESRQAARAPPPRPRGLCGVRVVLWLVLLWQWQN
jgi:hypothetical protein